MNYFTSCLYGDIEKYKNIRKDLALRPCDHLWILGDILDGNDENPEACIEIMDDIIKNSSVITLILGDHEYARCMEYSARGSAEFAEHWRGFSDSLDVPGEAFSALFESLGKEEREEYYSFLVNCELTDVVQIGGRHFYLVHGRPAVFSRMKVDAWQYEVCTELPDFRTDPWNCIRTDEAVIPYLKGKDPAHPDRNPISHGSTITVSGQMPASMAAEIAGVEYDGRGVLLYNRTLAIGRTYTDEPVPVVGIDAAGFFLAGMY